MGKYNLSSLNATTILFNFMLVVSIFSLCFSIPLLAQPSPKKPPLIRKGYSSPLRFGFTTGLSLPSQDYGNGLSLAAQWILPSAEDWKFRVRLHYSRYKGESSNPDTTNLSMNLDLLSTTSIAPFYYGVGIGYHFFSPEFSTPLPSIQVHLGYSHYVSKGFHWTTELSKTMIITNTKKLNPLTIRTGISLSMHPGSRSSHGRKKGHRPNKRFRQFKK